MHLITTEEEISNLESERALVGTYIDHGYSREKLDWIWEARIGFDMHVGRAFHLLIPHQNNGYMVNDIYEPEYGVALAREFINRLEIKHADLPCIVFRAKNDDCYFVKLGHRSKDDFLNIVGGIGDLAVECARKGPPDASDFRDWVNMQTANYLRRAKALSAIRSSLPAISGLLGGVVDITELV